MEVNLTPLEIIKDVKHVLGNIELDPCSSGLINESLGAERFYSLRHDGLSQEWRADTVFCSPPGTTIKRVGETEETWEELVSDYLNNYQGYKRGKPKKATQAKANEWHSKLFVHYISGHVKEAIGFLFYGGSIGTLPREILRCSLVITNKEAESDLVNSSGRTRLETLNRKPQAYNPQSSVFYLLSSNPATKERFNVTFSKYGVPFN